MFIMCVIIIINPVFSRAEVALTNERLMGVGQELNATAGDDDKLRSELNKLEQELMDLNATVAQKQRLLDEYRSSGFTGDRVSEADVN